MTSIAKTLLPAPARVDVTDESVVRQSSRGGMLRTHEPDAQVQPREWTLHYQAPHGAVVDAVRRHYREHCHEVFDWVPPGATDPVAVMHAAPPTITWLSNTAAAQCQVFLEEALAY